MVPNTPLLLVTTTQTRYVKAHLQDVLLDRFKNNLDVFLVCGCCDVDVTGAIDGDDLFKRVLDELGRLLIVPAISLEAGKRRRHCDVKCLDALFKEIPLVQKQDQRTVG